MEISSGFQHLTQYSKTLNNVNLWYDFVCVLLMLINVNVNVRGRGICIDNRMNASASEDLH